MLISIEFQFTKKRRRHFPPQQAVPLTFDGKLVSLKDDRQRESSESLKNPKTHQSEYQNSPHVVCQQQQQHQPVMTIFTRSNNLNI